MCSHHVLLDASPLLDADATIDEEPIILAAVKFAAVDLVDALVGIGHSINTPGSKGQTPLHVACRCLL